MLATYYAVQSFAQGAFVVNKNHPVERTIMPTSCRWCGSQIVFRMCSVHPVTKRVIRPRAGSKALPIHLNG